MMHEGQAKRKRRERTGARLAGHARSVFGALGTALALAACGGKDAAAPAAVNTPRLGINTAGGWSDSPFISRDGQRLYFMYSRYDFGPWILSGGTTLPRPTGPLRPGLHTSSVNPFDESDLYVATRQADGSWSQPVALGLNGPWGDASGMELNGGATIVWLRGNGQTNELVRARRLGDGSWGAPEALPGDINRHDGAALQDNPHLSPDGRALWFTSSRAGGLGGKDLWFSVLGGDGRWSAPLNVGRPVNDAGDQDQFWASPVTNEVFWTGPAGLMHCTSDGVSACATPPEPVTIPGCAFAAEASMPDDGQTLYFGCGDPATGRVSIMWAPRLADGRFGQARPVD